MENIYDPVKFWDKRGRTPMGENPKRYGWHKKYFVPYLRKIDFDSVLEVGCGDGRVTQYLLDNCKFSQYVGIDMSIHRIRMIQENITDWKGITSAFIANQYQDSIIKKRFDLVLAVETLLHIKPKDIEKFCNHMISNAKKHIIHMDYIPVNKSYEYPELEYYNFKHDYLAIWKRLLPDVKPIIKWVEPHEAFIHLEL